MQNIDEETSPAAESTAPDASREASDASGWLGSLAESAPPSSAPDAPKRETGSLPSWLRGLGKDRVAGTKSTSTPQDDLPAWLRDETGEVVAEPTRIEPTRPTDWQPAQTAETSQPEPPAQNQLLSRLPRIGKLLKRNNLKHLNLLHRNLPLPEVAPVEQFRNRKGISESSSRSLRLNLSLHLLRRLPSIRNLYPAKELGC